MNHRFYDDGSPIIITIGDHGLGPKFPEYEKTGLVRFYQNEETGVSSLSPLYVMPNVSIDVTGDQIVAARQQNSSQNFNSFDNQPIVEFINFGRSHRYYAKHYPLVADFWKSNLFTEARILARSLQGDQAIAYEFLEGDESLGAWMTHGIRSVADVFSRKPIPKPEDYDPLMTRVWTNVDKLKDSTAEDYSILHEVGIEFMRIRYEQSRLTRRIRQRLEDLIDSARTGEVAATEVEGAAFSVLDLYGQVRYSSDPASLAAYRCGVLLVRAGARFVGEKIADNSQRKAIQEAGIIIRGELPKIVSGLISGYLKKSFKNPQNPSLPERFAEETVSLIIWAQFFVVDFYIFEASQLPAAEKAKADDLFFEKLSSELPIQIISSTLKIGFGHKIDKLAENSPERLLLERLAAALPALIGGVIKEYVAMKKRSDEEKRPFFEVFCAEVGWALVRIFKAVGMALLEAPIQNAMKAKIASDKNYWKAVILALKLELSQLNPDFLKTSQAQPVAWNQKVPKLQPGPDVNGNVGINKLKAIAAEPNPVKNTKPPKPSKKERKKVQLEPKKNIRKGKEFTSAEKKVKYKENAKSVIAKWNEFKGKEPHYICENTKCNFVSPSKNLFQVDHVWDIQHGGDKNKMREGITIEMLHNDPKYIYEMGDNSMVLCIGCNGGKNSKKEGKPGFIPEGKGYAFVKPELDRNPDHLYQGGPK